MRRVHPVEFGKIPVEGDTMLAGRISELPSQVENGNVYQYLVPQDKSETLEIACVTLAPGNETRLAAHPDEEELYMFLEGRALLHIAGEEKEVGAGEFAYVPRHAEHFIKNTGEKGFRYVYVANFPDRKGKVAP